MGLLYLYMANTSKTQWVMLVLPNEGALYIALTNLLATLLLDPFDSVAATDPIAGCSNVLQYLVDMKAFKLLCINHLYPNMYYQ
jgi:hypothetical protein